MTDVVLAVDVGGTTVTAGLVTATGEVLWSVEAATVRTDRRRDPGLQQLAGIVRQLRQEAADHGHAVRAVTVGFPEYANLDCLTSNEVIDWDRQPAEVLGDDLDDVPLFVESDVRCAALAEARDGCSRRARHLLRLVGKRDLEHARDQRRLPSRAPRRGDRPRRVRRPGGH